MRVRSENDLDDPAIERLRRILEDVIDGQGNLTVEVVLPGVRAVDLRLLEVLVDAQRRLSARDGYFSVTTKGGSWAPDAAPKGSVVGRPR